MENVTHKQIMAQIMCTDMTYAIVGLVDGELTLFAMVTWFFMAQAVADSVAGSRIYDIEAQTFVSRSSGNVRES